MFSYLTGNTIASINCAAVKKRFSEFEDIVSINGYMANGVTFSLEANWTSPRKIRTLTVTGTRGILELDYITQRLILTQADDDERSVRNYSEFLLYNVVGEQRVIDVQPKEPLKVELEAFLKYAKDGGPSPVSAVAGLEALRAVELCKEKIK
jgi:UDP-N-acetylglucosamine 3-dehydrogenase